MLRSSLLSGSHLPAILAARKAPAIVHMSAYANTLTALVPQLYAAMDVVSRELVGFIPASMRAPGVERAAVGQSVAYPIAPTQVAYDVTPSMQIPEPPDNAITTGFMAITKSRAVPFGFTGEEQRLLNNGVGYLTAQGMLIAQALRTLCNEVEVDLSAEATNNASRAWGTGGTTPFASNDLTDLAQIQKILDDNGAPQTGRSMILNTSAAAKLQTINNLARVNEAGSTMTLRQGAFEDLYGMTISKTGQPVAHVKGTASGATTSGVALLAGRTSIPLAAAGTGTIAVGDTVSFAGDTNKYVVVGAQGQTTANGNVGAGGTIEIALPGLRVPIPAVATAITVGNSYLSNVAFSQDALHIAMRPPAIPVEGDARLDSLLITDPRSGITFEVSVWPGYRKVRAEIALAWGVKATKRENIALLLG